jgi:hypothetical protein
MRKELLKISFREVKDLDEQESDKKNVIPPKIYMHVHAHTHFLINNSLILWCEHKEKMENSHNQKYLRASTTK